MKQGSIILRITAGILYLLAVLMVPWWFAIIITPILMLVFKSYYEAIFVGFMIDVLYGAPLVIFGGFQFIFTAYATLGVILIFFLKKRLMISKFQF